jgi:outer membrane receptor protein involved in Fe transport
MAMTLRSRALHSVAFIGLAGMLTPQAYAQETAAETDDSATLQSEAEIESGQDASATEQGDITITGSRIRRPNLESTVPITSVGGEEFFETGQTSVGDVLNELPALRSTFSQSNSSRFLGTAGLNLLDLRGLGTQRTLVLVNGRRHVGSDILNNAVSPDVNTFPTDLIERVDVVTGGNSAIYGSDAIAGVVNFILKRNFEGLQIRGQGGVSKYGDAGSYYVSALAGRNFGGDRGNIAINLEYARQNDFYASGRPNLRQNNNFVVVDADIRCTAPGVPSNCDPAVDASNSDGNFDRTFFQDIRSATYTDAGTFLSTPNAQGFYTPFIFQPNGTLVQQTGTRIGRPPFGNFTGGNGDNFRANRQFGLSPALDRYSANLIAHFEVSKAFEPFVEAKYSRTDSLGNASGPFFTGASGSPRERFRTASNPFLNPQAQAIIGAYYGDFYGAYDANGDPTGNGVFDAIEYDYGFGLYRNVEEFGNREEEARRETYRIVTGVRGEFNDDWNYEVSANYGRFEEKTAITGNVNLQRYLLAIDAVRAPNGQIVCRSQIDPNARAILEGATVNQTFAQAQLAADVAACTPLNLFGKGNITQANRDYLLTDSFTDAHISQFVLNAFLSGDTSSFLNLPGGAVGFALGAEYRRESVFYDQDDFTQAGLSFYNPIGTFDPTSFEVKEVFGEIRLPLIRESFIHELTVSAAGRVSDYKGSTGTVFAYNAGVDFAPVRDLRLRANYSRAVRAPNLVDLFFPLSANFAPAPNDPCAVRNRSTGSANRAANCLAAGVPANFDYVYRSSLAFQSGGNPILREEKSDSLTVGGVFQPRFLPGFALTVDFYDITVNDVITSPSAQQILDACYDAATIENQFCDLFERQGAGTGPAGEITGRILENSLQVIPLNYAKLKVRGIDAEVSYRRTFAGLGRLSTKLTYTRVLKNDAFLNPLTPDVPNRALFELGDPRDAFNFDVDLKSGPITVGYDLRYIGKQVLNQYEDFFSVGDQPPQNADYADRRFYPAVFYHDVRLSIDAGEKFNFYMGIDNVLDRDPPFGLTGAGGGSAIFTNRGRFFYAGAVAKF